MLQEGHREAVSEQIIITLAPKLTCVIYVAEEPKVRNKIEKLLEKFDDKDAFFKSKVSSTTSDSKFKKDVDSACKHESSSLVKYFVKNVYVWETKVSRKWIYSSLANKTDWVTKMPNSFGSP